MIVFLGIRTAVIRVLNERDMHLRVSEEAELCRSEE